MKDTTCFACSMQHPEHSINCNSINYMKALDYFINTGLKYLSDEQLAELHFACYVETMERSFKENNI